MSVGWNATTDTGGSGLRAYNLYRAGAFLKQVMAPTTSTSDSGLAASTVYSYTVSAVDNAGNESARSATMSANTPACPDTTPPSTPTGLQASVASCSQINLTWTASTDSGGSGLAGYNVYRGGSFLKQVVGATSTSDGGLAASTTYSYTVSAFDNAGNQSSASVPASATTSTCSTVNPTLSGYVPGIGAAKDVIVAGTKAYVASAEFGLAVADITTPSAARALPGANPPFYGERVGVAGSVAVVTASTVGLKVLDLSDPIAARPVGSLSGAMKGLSVVGQYAYVINVVPGNPAHTDLIVVDLHTPSAPVIVGRVTIGDGSEVVVVGSFAYVPVKGAGLQVVDVSVPSSPRIVGSVDTPGNAWGVAVANGYAYVADETGLVVVDVSTPSRPTIQGSLATSATAVAVVGTRLYVVDGLLFKIVDVSNPAAPSLLYSGTGYDSQRIAASGSFAYLSSANVNASQNKGGLYVMDVSTPTAPRLLGNLYGGFDTWGVATSGSLGVVTGNLLGLKVVDVSSPTQPRPVATMAGTLRGVAMGGQYAYVMQTIPGNPAHIDLAVLDLRTPTAPAFAGRVTVGGGSEVTLAGSIAYVAASTVGLQLVDVSNPTAPRILSTVNTGGNARATAVANGYAYVADETGIVVVNVSNPSAPSVTGTLATSAIAVAVSGNRLYALDGLQLKVVDVSNPSAPTLLSTSTCYGAQNIDVSGTLAFLATAGVNHFDTTGGVYVLDVSTSQPRLVKQVIVPGTCRSVEAGAGLVYASDSASVIDVVDLVP
jgi:hypothetical protein